MSEATTLSTAALLDFTNKCTKGSLGFATADQDAAAHTLENTPFPTTRDEHWKYTRVTKISKSAFSQETADLDSIDGLEVLTNNNRLVFVNGIFSHDLSAIVPQDGVEFGLDIRIRCLRCI